MSLQKYINHKNKMKVEVCLETYKNHLWKLINKKISEGSKLKEIICKQKILSTLSETYYPQSDALRIAIASDNSFRIGRHIEDIKDWNLSKNNVECNKLIKLLELLESSRHLDIGEEDIQLSIKMHEDHYKKEIKQIADKIESVAKQIKWRNYDIKLEALVISDSFSIDEIEIAIEEEPSIILRLEHPEGQIIKASKYAVICESLLEGLKKFTENKKISTFYIENSYYKKRLIEEARKDLILGQRCYLPEGTILTKERHDNSAWMVKLEEKNLVCDEGKYIVGTKEIQIRFIEKI
jgi:hypothetical protein